MRTWVSMFLFASLLVLFVTGIVLYIEPPGRIAYWTNWHLLGLDKHQWDALHTIFGFLFLIFSIWHLFLNWRPLSWGLKKPVVLGVVIFISLFVFWGTVTYRVPFRYVIDWQQIIKNSWPVPPPPIPHAEAMPLGRVARLLGLHPQEALKILRQANIKVSSPQETMGQIAKQNGKTPNEVFEILRKQKNN